MDDLDRYLVARFVLLAHALERLEELPAEQRVWVSEAASALLDLLVEALTDGATASADAGG